MFPGRLLAVLLVHSSRVQVYADTALYTVASVALLRSQIILNNHLLKTLLESVTFFKKLNM